MSYRVTLNSVEKQLQWFYGNNNFKGSDLLLEMLFKTYLEDPTENKNILVEPITEKTSDFEGKTK